VLARRHDSPYFDKHEPDNAQSDAAAMTLTQLRYFAAIADSGLNITLAAERVHATQPGLSKQLKQLEDELGFLLFSRKGRSLDSITPAGTQVLAHARRLLAEASNIRSYAANQRRDGQGRLVLATTHTQARFVLPPAIAKVKQAYPRVSVHLQPSSESEVLELLARGEADFALISTAGDPPVGGIGVPLFRWKRVVLVQRTHAFAKAGTAPTLAQLAKQPLVSYESSVRPESSLRRAFAATGLEPQLAMTARDADLIKTYVRAGLGVGLLAEMAVNEREDTDLVVLPAPAAIPECIAWAVLPRERVLRDYTIELLRTLAPQIDQRDLQRVLAGNQAPDWPQPPSWVELTQTITV
jgi:LysR family transcriptional regulator, cys regulon transcriptional activator